MHNAAATSNVPHLRSSAGPMMSGRGLCIELNLTNKATDELDIFLHKSNSEWIRETLR